jgi:hypothetical protein
MKNYKVKVCLRCGKDFKPNSPFQKYCIECAPIIKKKQNRQWNKEHSEKMKEINRKWKEEHSEKVKLQIKQWAKTHLEERRESHRKGHYIRKHNFSYIPLNSWHEGYVFHHLDKVYGVYMPEEEHQNISHSVLRNRNMDEINAVAFNYLGVKDG